MSFFGSQKDNMANEGKETVQEAAQQPSRPTKKDVDIFPALLDRRTAPIVAPRPSAVGAQISMFTPSSFEEALEIVECLRSRASTTICLEKMRKQDAGRLVDFVSGASAAIDGNFHKLSEQVYLFCPSNMKIVVPGKRDAATTLDFLYDSQFSSKSSFSHLWSKS